MISGEFTKSPKWQNNQNVPDAAQSCSVNRNLGQAKIAPLFYKNFKKKENMKNKEKTIFEILPELNQIARRLSVNVNNRKVLNEYFKIHPEEKNRTR